jgi:hypothetical protein
MEQLDVSERKIFRVLNQPQSTQRYFPKVRAGEELLVKQII